MEFSEISKKKKKVKEFTTRMQEKKTTITITSSIK